MSRIGQSPVSIKENVEVILENKSLKIKGPPRGVMSDNEAREANVGGEVLCTIY